MRSFTVTFLVLASCDPVADLRGGEPARDRAPPVLGPVQVEAGVGCARVRAAVDEPVTVTLVVWPEGQDAVELPGGEADAQIDVPLPFRGLASGWAPLVVRAADRSGNSAEAPVAAVAIEAPPPEPLVIAELLSNPAGAEGVQEWIELVNTGEQPRELGGYLIEDATGKDVLPSLVLPAGGRALLVPSGFVAGAGGDVRPPDAVPLVRVDARLGGNGLSNTGEQLRLLDATGRPVSVYGGWVNASGDRWPGKSIQRLSLEACDHPSTWSPKPGDATPGW